MAVNKEALFKKRVKEADVEIPDVGVVRVRALTRAQVLSLGIGTGEAMEASEMEKRLISMGLVDPVLTEDEVAQWQEASPANELNDVSEMIMELSGVNMKEVTKETIKQFQR